MKTVQVLLLSALLLVAISHAEQHNGAYLQLVASISSPACQLKHLSCGNLQTSGDYCSQVKNAKQCATTGSVLTNGSIAICTDTEYQQALYVACMSAEQGQKFDEFFKTLNQLNDDCNNTVINCLGAFFSPIPVKELCKSIKEGDACLSFSVSVKQSCKSKYEEMKTLACSTGTQNIVQNITFLMLACVLSLISRHLLMK